MDALNLNHLRYFWAVYRTGSIAAAGQELHLSQPTISAQLKQLETALGQPLFDRVGRRLVPTDFGHMAYRYAEEIFSLSREMLDSVRHVSEGQPLRLRVGVADVIPKLMARRLLQPALELDRPVHLICHEAKAARLETELAAHTYDVVLTDAPLSGRSRIRAFSHPLGKCGVVFQAAPELARRYRRGFPGSLDDAPMLLPTDTHVLRSQLERWFSKQGVRPHVVAEFEDTALLKEFAADGLGVFAVPDVIEDDVRKRCGTRVVGRAPLEERIYAISLEQRLRHPAVRAILDAARTELFG